ncbi:MAG: hypothetical protein FJ290_16650 [Planctomycetes bacterium]|nr:hypothetical protein [Planctomycetota bacterium]
MRKRLTSLVSLPLCLLAAGCTLGFGPRRSAVFAPVVEKPADDAWPFTSPAVEPPKEPPKDAPRLRVFTWFLAGQPSDFAKLGIDCEKPYSLLTGAQHGKTLSDLLRSRRLQVVTAPRLTVVAGQTASIAVTIPYDYLGDYKPGKAEGQAKAAYAPVMHRILDGLVLNIRAEQDGDQVAFTSIEPRMANSLGMRDCKGFLDLNKSTTLLVWQEPVFLSAEALLPPGQPIVCKQGCTLALPLKHTVRDTRATIRKLLVAPVEVLNRDTMKFLTRLDRRGYPLPGRIVVLLTARLATEKDNAPAPPEAPKP